MRTTPFLILAAVLALPSVGKAAPPVCYPDPAADPLLTWEKGGKAGLPGPHKTECLKDDLLILQGDDTMVSCTNKTDPNDCSLNYAKAVDRAVDVIMANGGARDDQWDELVVFGQGIAPAADPPGPLFYREGYREEAANGLISSGVNEVTGIGLELSPRVPGRPFVGYVAAGGTSQVSKGDPIASFAACGTAATDPTSDLKAKVLCFAGFYNFFDALAQATGAIYGPYLALPMELVPKANPLNALSAAPSLRSGLVIIDFRMKTVSNVDAGLRPRIWNSFLDTRGSLFAGNTFRNNGNGTYETTMPSPFYGINLPFATPTWKAGTVLSGSQILRFQPLDLYALGLIPSTDIPDMKSFISATPDELYQSMLNDNFDAATGPMMGLRTGVAIRPKAGPATVNRDAIVMANGERVPSSVDAPHYLRQLWILVLKPQALIDSTAKLDAQGKTDQTDLANVRSAALEQIDWAVSWRRQFAAYFYMMTSYRGRLVTTYDGKTDDNAYWEFGQPADDRMTFVPDPGVEVEFNGPEAVPNSPEIKSVMRFTNIPEVPDGQAAGVKYSGKPLGLRIIGSQSATRTPNNAVAVRMRIPPGGPSKAYATLSFDGGPSIHLPSSCGSPARVGCTEAAFLIPDGNWRTYSATLSANDAFTNGTFAGFSFSPSSRPYSGEGIEVEFIRVSNVPSSKDSDVQCVACRDCAKLKVKDSVDACTSLCKDKSGSTVVSVPLPDGWIDSEDNCPQAYNPLQEDGNADGVGDACEDFDGDGVINACDNCPTVTNSRQRDSNNNGIGDVCDGSSDNSCFLQPSSLAGPVGAAPGALFGVVCTGTIGLLVMRRRRKSSGSRPTAR